MYLELNFRISLFCKAYESSNESLSELAKEMGYVGKGKNGKVRDMWLGLNSIPESKLNVLSQITGISEKDILNNRIRKEKNKKIDDWFQTLKIYQNNFN